MTDVRRLTQSPCDDYPHLSVCSSCLLLFLFAVLLAHPLQLARQLEHVQGTQV